MRISTRHVIASCAIVSVLLTSGSLAAQDRLSFERALTAAARHAGEGRIPAEITLLGDGGEARYEVLFLTGDGSESVVIDASDGRLLRRERTAIDGRLRQNVRRRLRAGQVTLRDAIGLAERRTDAPLRRVAFQTFEGELVVSVQVVEDGEVVGRVFDASSGRMVVGERVIIGAR